MSGLRISLTISVLLVALPAPAAAADVCAAFNRIIASSRGSPPFGSIRHALANGEAVIPGFDAANCQVTTENAVDCRDRAMTIHNFDDWPDLATCPGFVAEEADLPTPPRRNRGGSYVASGLRFQYGVHCTGCAGPASSRFTVSAIAPRRPDD